jgi:O-acetyl-ADP-ribose deacetylase (regulator of RNase III)
VSSAIARSAASLFIVLAIVVSLILYLQDEGGDDHDRLRCEMTPVYSVYDTCGVLACWQLRSRRLFLLSFLSASKARRMSSRFRHFSHLLSTTCCCDESLLNTSYNNMMLKTVASFALGKGISLKIARGSVLDFMAIPNQNETNYKAVGAIVNAANEGCLGGGGVDGAIGQAGGESLFRDRKALPVIPGGPGIRCRKGDAVITGPGNYGKLRVPYVIHAVGPAYFEFEDMMEDEDDFSYPDSLLRSAYQQTLERCKENNITDVGFSLLSAGIFRGRQSMKNVLAIGVAGIRDWVETTEDCGTLKTVTLCGFSGHETAMLMYACKQELLGEGGAQDDSSDEENSNGEATPNPKRTRPSSDSETDDSVADDKKDESKPSSQVATSEGDVPSNEAAPMDMDGQDDGVEISLTTTDEAPAAEEELPKTAVATTVPEGVIEDTEVEKKQAGKEAESEGSKDTTASTTCEAENGGSGDDQVETSTQKP